MSNLTEQLLSYLKQRADMADSTQTDFRENIKVMKLYFWSMALFLISRLNLHRFKVNLKPVTKTVLMPFFLILDLHYCEGYGFDQDLPISLYHAWLVNDKGEVIDPTWLKKDKTIYLGVVFNKDFVLETLNEIRQYSIIENDYKIEYKLKKNGFTSEMLNKKFHKL